MGALIVKGYMPEAGTSLLNSSVLPIEGFAEGPEGHILLQDEGAHRVWFRSIKIRER